MLTRSLFATLAATAVLVAGCGSDSAPEPSPGSATAPPASAGPADNRTTVPAELQFTATTIDGKEFSGESLVGSPAVLWFWAPWCPTCQREAPMVGRIAEGSPDVTFVGVGALDELPAMQQFVDTYPVDGFCQLADTGGAVWAKFGVTHQPAYAFVSADGAIDVVRGSLSEQELTERVAALSPQ